MFRHQFQTILIVILFYCVGFLGLEFTVTQPVFLALIPFALLLSFVAILLSHHSQRFNVEFAVLLLIFLLGYFIELAGVNTHMIFGNYLYGNGLGIKFFGTPLLIGINWVMVVYCSASVSEWIGGPRVFQILLAASLMVLYDFVLEHIAPVLDMWKWEGNMIPFQNYMAWFTIAIAFQGLLKWMKVSRINPIAAAIFICQFLFFVLILIFLK